MRPKVTPPKISVQEQRPAIHPEHLAECVEVVDRLRALRELIEDDLIHCTPPGWCARELAAIAVMAEVFEVRLMASASPEIRSAYLKHLAQIQA